jgi:protein SCO1
MRMSWRLASRFSVITLALLVVIVVALWGLHSGPNGVQATTTPSASQSGLQGTDLGSDAAPDFHLNDQFGKPISLSQFHGEPVVLTFLYTHCPNACPLTADKLHVTQTQLGKNAAKVMMLAVSIDPIGDTQATAQNFSQVHKLTSNWHYLLGTQNQLSPIWDAYSIAGQATANHSTAIYVIDKQGRERIFFDGDFTSDQLTSDLNILLQE